MSSRSFGVVYVATGNAHSQEALHNVQLSSPFLSGISTCLITDKIRGLERLHFDQVRFHPNPVFSYRDKISGLLDLPFDVNLFLDSDAFLSFSVDSIFELTSNFEFSAVHAPVRHPPGWRDLSAPLFFPEYNSGVMVLTRCTNIVILIDRWLQLYDRLLLQFNQNWDQASLRSSLWTLIKSHNLSIATLPVEANLRTTKPWIAGRGLPVSVIHGRFPNSEIESFVSYLNSDIDRFRTWSEWLNLFPDTSIRPRFDRTYS